MPKQEYFPQFYRRTRPYVKAFLKDVEDSYSRGERNTAGGLATKAYRAELLTSAGASTYSQVSSVTELQAAATYAQWHLGGGIVYEFDPALVQALEHSDAGEVLLSDLNHPFDSVYFAFGSGHDIKLANGATVTGAYVLNTPGVSLRVVLTAPLPDTEDWWQRQAEVYDVVIPARFQHLPLEEAIDLAIQADIDDFKKATGPTTDYRAKGEGPAIDHVLLRIESNGPAYRQAVNLIVNGLLYVTAYAQDVEERWQDGTPEKWVEKASTGTPKEIQRNRSKLSAMGFIRIRRVGGYFSTQASLIGRAAHWRRGHFRQQAFGPRMSLRRLVWIRPVAVLGGTVPEDEPRAYEVPLKESALARNVPQS
ncbi:hypothetical protein [Burkholderia cenocepacia]|uniref:hypothetical protein n=1 Tax=Burkholderia cenocepacia TaxID=95486 RepID=UPI00076DE910|nr:hypothetical protein [Burkholderia cenocepacia]KWU17913.1 hypothetical protein AS149_14655 [Burkholderia cenocepacia]